MSRPARRAAGWSLLALTLAVGSLDGQPTPTRLERAIDAYERLDFNATVVHIRNGLALPNVELIPDSLRAVMLGYLGAAEFMSGRVEAARDAFREALERVPLYRLDTLVFPPLLTEAFESLRSETLFVSVRVVADGGSAAKGRDLVFILHASWPHRVIVVAEFSDGRQWEAIYDGEIRDRLHLRWRDTAEAGESGDGDSVAITLEVLSLTGGGRIRRLRLPVGQVRATRPPDYTAAVTRSSTALAWPSIVRIHSAKRGMPASIVTFGE